MRQTAKTLGGGGGEKSNFTIEGWIWRWIGGYINRSRKRARREGGSEEGRREGLHVIAHIRALAGRSLLG